MTTRTTDIIRLRLRNQQLSRSDLRTPQDAVAWLGAVQAQDYAGAKWGVGLRVAGCTDAQVEQAVHDGAILRTHVLRPTWHLLAPADIRWVLKLSAPRVHAVSAYYYRQAGVDAKVVARSRRVLERALRDRRYRTRTELAAIFEQGGIPAAGLALAYVLMHAELEGLICSGPRRGKQSTYALLEERVAPAPPLTRDESLAALTRRYFISRGPATVRDFSWWSGLTAKDAMRGLEASASLLTREVIDGRTYWLTQGTGARRTGPTAWLLPNYDEYGIAYKDREILAGAGRQRPDPSDTFAHLLIIDGRLEGRWKRTLKPRTAAVELQPFRTLLARERRAVDAAVARYGAFLQVPVTLSIA